ncbi:hypothetical protein B0H11DRAFT_1956665 [Mycena galericulata]|nr:hypothetical protein B0H11DRAFT_1956665 [Mycena galericulata]
MRMLMHLQGRNALDPSLENLKPSVGTPDTLGNLLNRVCGPPAAFKSLPDGVLGQIFDHFVRARPAMDCRKRALVLCGVSRRWRVVAVSTPVLWTSLELIIRPGWKPAFDRMCILRSSPLPLDIHLHYQEYFPSALDNAVRLIWRNLPRIRYLFLDLLEPWNGPFPTRPAHVFPNLRNMRVASQLTILDVSLPTRTNAWDCLSALVGNAPKLRAFSFVGDLIPNTPWAQLTSLSLGPITLRESLRVLSCAPRLRSCDFIIISLELPPAPERRILVHPLQCLMLQGADDVTVFLAHVKLPHLISLAISGARNASPHVLDGFFSRSVCNLRRLNLLETHLNNIQIFQIISHPCLQRLKSLNIELSNGIITRNLVFLLRLVCGQRPLIPLLRRIYLTPVIPGLVTLVFTLSDKGIYTASRRTVMPSMSPNFTYDIPDSERDD